MLETREDYRIVVSIGDEKRRERLFKHLDEQKNRPEVAERTATKRVISVRLFDRLQSKIDNYPHARVSLVNRVREGEYEVVVPDSKPMSDSYNEILRRLRF